VRQCVAASVVCVYVRALVVCVSCVVVRQCVAASVVCVYVRALVVCVCVEQIMCTVTL